MFRRALQLALLLSLTLLAGCWSSRVHRMTDTLYPAKAKDAPIELVVGKWNRAYETIATVDSDTYANKDEAAKGKMLDDIRKRARKIGADAVQDIHLLPIKVRGVVLDEGVPVAGAWKQGHYELYFLRGEAIKFVASTDGTTGQQNSTIASPEQPKKHKKKKKGGLLDQGFRSGSQAAPPTTGSKAP